MVWILPVTVADTYDIYARWGSSNSGAANAAYTITHAGGTDTVNANYTITHAGGTDTVTLDQTTAYDGNWIKLGTYDLAPDAGHKVTLSDRANGQVAADAIRIVSASGGERVARWQGSVASAGTYQVWARWTAAPTHSFAATYRVTTPGGTDSVTVDQRSGGGQWHLLKTLTLAANDTWQVELSDQSPGEVVADAIAVTPPISLADTFEWAPTLPAAGDYAVYAKWQADPSRASDATYEITHDGGVSQVSVDQTHNGGEWRYLGRWSFDPLNAPKVTLLGSLTGTLSADAIRFVAGDSIGGDIAYTHADQLGTIQKMTDASGALAWDRIQRPFGETVSISAASGVAQMLRFPGQYADETGLSYNYFRDYDPTLGRYLESDPIGLGGGVNTYGYVGGNPVKYVDPTGEFWQVYLYWAARNYVTCVLIHAAAQQMTNGCVDWERAALESLDCIIAVNWVPKWARVWVSAGRAGGKWFGKGKKADEPGMASTGSGGGNEGGDKGKPKPDKPGKDDGDHKGPTNPPNPDDFTDPDNLPDGWEWRGRGKPGSRDGAYHNPGTGESLHDDTTHPAGKDPHYTYTDPDGRRWDKYPDREGGWEPQK